MADHQMSAPQGGLALVDKLLRLAYAMPECEPGSHPRARAFTDPSTPSAIRLKAEIAKSRASLQATWNSLVPAQPGRPSWGDTWQPACLDVAGWEFSSSYEQRRRELLRTLVGLRVAIDPEEAWSTPSSAEQSNSESHVAASSLAGQAGASEAAEAAGREATNGGPEPANASPPVWEQLSDKEQKVLTTLGSNQLQGKSIAKAIQPEWDHNSIGRELLRLKKAGFLEKAPKKRGYRLVRRPEGAPASLQVWQPPTAD